MKTFTTRASILTIVLFTLSLLNAFTVTATETPNRTPNTASLNSFSAVTANKKIQLLWNVDANNVLSTIVVEKAYSADTFVSIGEIWVTSESQEISNYSFRDKVSHGNVYYRLKMINTNGQVSYSSVLTFKKGRNVNGQF